MNLIDYVVLEVLDKHIFTGYGTQWKVICKTVDMGGIQEEYIYGSFFCTCVVKKGYKGLH